MAATPIISVHEPLERLLDAFIESCVVHPPRTYPHRQNCLGFPASTPSLEQFVLKLTPRSVRSSSTLLELQSAACNATVRSCRARTRRLLPHNASQTHAHFSRAAASKALQLYRQDYLAFDLAQPSLDAFQPHTPRHPLDLDAMRRESSRADGPLADADGSAWTAELLWNSTWGWHARDESRPCRDAREDARQWCAPASPPEALPRSRASAFGRAMHGAGVLVMAVDSRVISPAHHASFDALLSATRWLPWAGSERLSPPLLSLSYLSARVPNVFCAQPDVDALACGTHDVLLLFRATARLLGLSCAATLNDACGHSMCEPPMVSRAKRAGWLCPTSLDEPVERELAAGLCPLPGGCYGEFAPGRCTVTRSPNATRRRLHLETAMRGFWRACRRPAQAESTFAHMPTGGGGTGALQNELQFLAGRGAHRLNAALEHALIGVGTINVVGSQLEPASAARVCRARWLAAALSSKFGLRKLEVWRFAIDPALTPGAPLEAPAARQCSKTPPCAKGGKACARTDFGIFTHSVTRTVVRRGGNITIEQDVPTAPRMPLASSWGYLLAEDQDVWERWDQFRA